MPRVGRTRGAGGGQGGGGVKGVRAVLLEERRRIEDGSGRISGCFEYDYLVSGGISNSDVALNTGALVEAEIGLRRTVFYGFVALVSHTNDRAAGAVEMVDIVGRFRSFGAASTKETTINKQVSLGVHTVVSEAGGTSESAVDGDRRTSLNGVVIRGDEESASVDEEFSHSSQAYSSVMGKGFDANLAVVHGDILRHDTTSAESRVCLERRVR